MQSVQFVATNDFWEMYLQITEEVEPGPYLLKGVYSETVKL